MKKKCAMNMADGGVYPQERTKKADETPEWQKSLKAAWDAISGGERKGDKEKSQDEPRMMGPIDAIIDRKKKNRDALNYAKGGVIPVKGKGTSTSDSVPAIVAGQEVGLSKGEGIATLPAKTMKTPGAINAIESIIQATNDGKPPVPTKAGGRAAGGVTPDEELAKKAAAGDAGKIVRDGSSFSMSPSALAPASGQQMTNPNQYPYTGAPAPTAQQVYAGAGKGIGDAIATHAFPSTTGAIQKHGDAAQAAAAAGNYGGALGQVARGGIFGAAGLVDDTMRSAAKVLDPAANALKTFVTGDNSPARAQEPAGIAAGLPTPTATPATSAAADRAIGVPNYPSPAPEKTAIADEYGTKRFTSPGYDPTTQQYPDGGGAITGKGGRTILLAGNGIAGGLPAAGGQAQSGNVDAHGNNMALTDGYRRQLADVRAENSDLAASRQPSGPVKSYADQQRESADRFTQFVNESSTATAAHDLGTGGGTPKTNAGKIAALAAMQQRDAAVRGNATAQSIADSRGATDRDVAGIAGNYRLAGINAEGQSRAGIEQMHQSSPLAQSQVAAAQTQQQQTRGKIADADQLRNVRDGIASAYQSGDPAKIAAARQLGIANGIFKPDPLPEYQTIANPMGGFMQTDKRSGAGRVVGDNGAETALPAIGGSRQAYPPAPQKVEDREKDHIYISPTGKPGRWNGKDWDAV